ncbi:transcriptional regulator, LacI family [Paenibacillus sophorae]|uniref:LacI family transcriptional regulator n=1 Tax=Paenibacillus sophorae TaxID=1333845 RepID=A0A1H8K1P8_9BACL|nr:LacI family DNA-binding transcriptional regulator [Paenibacillus sophorae]QWU13561.1 LacI family transcriptional regulator [Paenibacillus sophorae]SEN86715.1 transcriptional regulator, LacI family [Paenibacillus sophorae]
MSFTIKDVARLADVSIATVSRVLNRSKPVSPEVREKVMKVVDELGYNPNPVARTLIMKESMLIGVLIPDIANTFISMFVRGIEKELFQQGYTALLCNTNSDTKVELHYLNLLREKYVDGVVLLTSAPKPEQIDFFNNHDIPVIFSSHTDKDSRFPCINIDDYQASYDATKYLIGLGHRSIAFFCGPMEYYQTIRRFDGYKQALADYGIEFQTKWLFARDYNIESGYKSGMELFAQEDQPTAVCCVSDMVAIGAIRAAEDSGVSVPEDVSIMGFDDIPIAGAYRPALTTIRQPVYDLGAGSAQMLLKQIREKDNYIREAKILPHEIIERESCRVLNN